MMDVFKNVFYEFVSSLLSLLPNLLLAVIFLAVSYGVIRFIQAVLRSSLDSFFDMEEQLIGTLVTNVAGAFLWFSVILIQFKILGMEGIAASLGTASGFAALGISFALSSVIADLVAGVYLIRDPDFSRGDRIRTGSVTGTVRSVELRKSRIVTEEGETVVMSNAEVEKQWTRLDDDGDAPPVDEGGADDATGTA